MAYSLVSISFQISAVSSISTSLIAEISAGPPVFSSSFPGQFAIDTVNQNLYISEQIGHGANDWKLASNLAINPAASIPTSNSVSTSVMHGSNFLIF